MSLLWAILEYPLNQTWDYAIYHRTFSHQNFIISKITYVKFWDKEKRIDLRYPTNYIPPVTEEAGSNSYPLVSHYWGNLSTNVN